MDENFYQVIALHQKKDLDWESISEQIPELPRGWFELCRFSSNDRIEFIREFWLSKFDAVEERIYAFFSSLENIGMYATQEKVGFPFDVHMAYELKDDAGFFYGRAPISESNYINLIRQFEHVNLPADYLAFLQIHDGFSKYADTGILKSRDMARTFQHLQQLLVEQVLVRPDKKTIDPSSLIPFYESFGLHCYQCFYADWEMGNVYFSENDRTISNFLKRDELDENLAFKTFLGWLVFYLEDIFD